jgi:hypothetical protein
VCQFLLVFTRVRGGVGWTSCVRMDVFGIKLDSCCSASISPIIDVMW